MGLLRAGWNLTAMLVGIFVLPLGYLMIGKPIRGLLVTLLIALISIFTLGAGLLLLPVAWIDILTGGNMG